MADTTTCGAPWVPLDGLLLCTAADFADGVLALALDGATDLLNRAAALQYPGVCTDKARPCSDGAAGSFLGRGGRTNDGGRWYAGDSFSTWDGTGGWGCSCPAGGVSPGCGWQHDMVALPSVPVVSIDEVKIDGVVLDADEYRIVDDRWLVRRGHTMWPWSQRLDRDDTEPGAWSVTWKFGTDVPASGLIALQVLACEFAKSLSSSDECRLPKHLQSLTREGLSMVVLDPFAFLKDGGFGIYEVDTFIRAVNPNGLVRDARFVNPETVMQSMPHRTR